MRKCLKCEGPVVLHEALGFGPIGGTVGIGGVIFIRLIGPALAGAIVCGIGSLCALLSLTTMKYQCSLCDKAPPVSVLSKDEKAAFQKRRLGFLLGSIGLGVVS